MRGRKSTVTLVGPGERIRDEEGRWSALGTPTVVPRAVLEAATAGFTARSSIARGTDSAVLLLPLSLAVTEEHLVEVAGSKSVPAGTYRVESVVSLRKHHRCLLRRYVPGGSD